MSVRHAETGQASWCKFQIVKFMFWGVFYEGVQEEAAYSELISELVIQEAVQETATNEWRGAIYEERLKELNVSRLVKKVLYYRRELYAVFQINTPAMEKKLLGLCKLTIDKT